MSLPFRALLAFVASALVLAHVGRAQAFCRTKTCKVPADFNPAPGQCDPPDLTSCVDDDGVRRTSIPIWWRTSCVGYSVQRDASRFDTLSDVEAAADAAFQAWSSTICSGDTGSGPVSIRAHFLGTAACADGGYYSDRPDQQAIIFRDDVWPNQDAPRVIALTTMHYDVITGEIYGADIELNTATHRIIVTSTPSADGYDLQRVLTHEAGHFLGMAHSPDMSAVMYYEDEGGSATNRGLSPDDQAGICSVYLPDGRRVVDPITDKSGFVMTSGCNPEPRHGFSSECATSPTPMHRSGCSCRMASTSTDFAAIFPAVALVSLARARRKRHDLRY